MENCQIHFTADYPTIETVFRIIISANQLSIYGAVATICEEFETHQDGSGEPDVLMGYSIVLGEIKAEKQNIDPMWKLLNEEVDLGEPISFLGHVYLV